MSFLNTGNDKAALVIGINYTGHQHGVLRGCINDTQKIVNFLKSRCGFLDENIIILTDDNENKPTKNNIENAIKKLVNKSDTCKELWFSYSGHGSYITSYKEKDNKDEVLVPLDYQQNGVITDNYLYSNLIKKLPLDCKLFSIVDACHSGTSMDLPYVYRCDTGIQNNRNDENTCDVIKISGCRDNQTSADAYINGTFQGALTFGFIKTMEDFNFNFTPQQIINRVKSYLNTNNYEQIPTLSLSKKTLLDDLVMGDCNKKLNTNIYLEGDNWSKEETTWNIFSIKNNKYLFEKDKKFYLKNEKINFKLYLEDGNYILELKDTYGDGGVKGNISNLINKKSIVNFNFNNGSYKRLNFTIKNLVEEKQNITLNIKGDYYVKYESSFNILDRLGGEMYKENLKFEKSNETKIIDLKLHKGKYKLKCMDTYGDGGMEGFIKQDNKVILSFNWNNLNWKNENGYLKYYDFEII